MDSNDLVNEQWSTQVLATASLVQGTQQVVPVNLFQASWGRWGSQNPQHLKPLGVVSDDEIVELTSLPYVSKGDNVVHFALQLCAALPLTSDTPNSCFIFTDSELIGADVVYPTLEICVVNDIADCTAYSIADFLKSKGVTINIDVVGVQPTDVAYALSSCESDVIDETCPHVKYEPDFSALVAFYENLDFSNVACTLA